MAEEVKADGTSCLALISDIVFTIAVTLAFFVVFDRLAKLEQRVDKLEKVTAVSAAR